MHIRRNCTDRVVLTDKQITHMAYSHPEAYVDVVERLNDTIVDPDYIICDEKHKDTGLVVKGALRSYSKNKEVLYRKQ